MAESISLDLNPFTDVHLSRVSQNLSGLLSMDFHQGLQPCNRDVADLHFEPLDYGSLNYLTGRIKPDLEVKSKTLCLSLNAL